MTQERERWWKLRNKYGTSILPHDTYLKLLCVGQGYTADDFLEVNPDGTPLAEAGKPSKTAYSVEEHMFRSKEIEARHNPPSTPGEGARYFRHGGRCYLNTGEDRLPSEGDCYLEYGQGNTVFVAQRHFQNNPKRIVIEVTEREFDQSATIAQLREELSAARSEVERLKEELEPDDLPDDLRHIEDLLAHAFIGKGTTVIGDGILRQWKANIEKAIADNVELAARVRELEEQRERIKAMARLMGPNKEVYAPGGLVRGGLVTLPQEIIDLCENTTGCGVEGHASTRGISQEPSGPQEPTGTREEIGKPVSSPASQSPNSEKPMTPDIEGLLAAYGTAVASRAIEEERTGKDDELDSRMVKEAADAIRAHVAGLVEAKERAEKDLERMEIAHTHTVESWGKDIAERDAARARVAELEGALRPFAELDLSISSKYRAIGDYVRAAAAALQGAK